MRKWGGGVMGDRKNKNRGVQQLRVWQDAIALKVEMQRLVGQAIASAESVDRNIAESYFRESIQGFVQDLCIALVAAESLPGHHAYRKGGPLSGKAGYQRFECDL